MPAKPQISRLDCTWAQERLVLFDSPANIVYDLLLTHGFSPIKDGEKRSKLATIELIFDNKKAHQVARCKVWGTGLFLHSEGKWYLANLSPADLAEIKDAVFGGPDSPFRKKIISPETVIGDFCGKDDISFEYGSSTYKITFNDLKTLMPFPKLRKVEKGGSLESIGMVFVPKRYIQLFSDGDSLIVEWRLNYYSAGKGSLATFIKQADSIAKSREKVDIKDGSPKEDATKVPFRDVPH